MKKKSSSTIFSGLEKVYDEFADIFVASRERFDTKPILEEFLGYLPKNPRILDVGCGAGEPVAKFLIENGCLVTGIDISERMLEIAKNLVPNATFQKQNIMQMSFSENSFEGVVSVYSMFHIPREKHQEVFLKFRQILTKDGMVLLTLATKEYTGFDEFDGELEFLDQKLPYSHDNPKVALKKLTNSGFEIVSDKLITNGRNDTFLWVIARNKK